MWGLLLVLVVLGVIVGLPVWLARTSPRRGLGGARPKHPFRLPQAIGWFIPTGLPGMGDTDPQDDLDLPPLGDPPARRGARNRHGRGR